MDLSKLDASAMDVAGDEADGSSEGEGGSDEEDDRSVTGIDGGNVPRSSGRFEVFVVAWHSS